MERSRKRRWAGKKPGLIPPTDAESGVKRSLLTEEHGVPIGLVAEGANRHDMKLTRATVMRLIVERPEPTHERPRGMCLDAGYDYDEVYAILKEFGQHPHMCASVGKKRRRLNTSLVSKRAGRSWNARLAGSIAIVVSRKTMSV
jgi:hypothetical protein